MVYQWRCEKCGTLVEVSRPMAESDVEPDSCPKCDSKDFSKVYSASEFILQGEGWFKKGGY